MTRVAINGFGRIGRVTARLLQDRTDIELVAVNAVSGLKRQVRHRFPRWSLAGLYSVRKESGSSG